MLHTLLPVLIAEFGPAEDNFVFPPRMTDLLRETAQDYRLTVDEIRSASHAFKVSHARQDFYYRCALHTLRSYPEIGRFIGRDHTTIMYGIAAHCKRNGIPTPRGLKCANWMWARAK